MGISSSPDGFNMCYGDFSKWQEFLRVESGVDYHFKMVNCVEEGSEILAEDCQETLDILKETYLKIEWGPDKNNNRSYYRCKVHAFIKVLEKAIQRKSSLGFY